MTPDRLAVLAHELRSPVAALVALAVRAGDMRLTDDAFGRLLALALAAGRDVERLLLDPDLVSVQSVEIDLADLLRAVARPRVVVAVEPVTVVGDPTRLRQAIGNLVANGLRHGTEVTIDARRDGDRAVIDVRDDGPGVDPAIDPFVKGVSAAGSSGYGLWLARAIAEAHGGRLEHASAPGQGAVFRLSLPLASGASG
jgi:two-component system OmpR family sensor kinase